MGVNPLERSRRKTIFQVAVHPAELTQLRRREHECQVRFAAEVGIAGQPRMRGRGIGRAKGFELRQRGGRLTGWQVHPMEAVHPIKQVQHVNALRQSDRRRFHNSGEAGNEGRLLDLQRLLQQFRQLVENGVVARHHRRARAGRRRWQLFVLQIGEGDDRNMPGFRIPL